MKIRYFDGESIQERIFGDSAVAYFREYPRVVMIEYELEGLFYRYWFNKDKVISIEPGDTP